MNQPVFLGVVTFLLALGAVVDVQADIYIDFEDPLLGFRGQEIMDPFVNQGLSFTAEPFPGTAPLDEVTGLVWNQLSNACVEPANIDVTLGTGRELTPPNGRVGLDGYPIKATLQTAISPNKAQGDQVQVSVEFQTVTGKEVRLRLYNSSDEVVAEEVGVITRNQGDCGRPGSSRGSLRLTAVTQEELAYFRVDIPDNLLGGIAYVIDDIQVKFALGTQQRGTPVGELCSRLARSSSRTFTLETAADCQVIDIWNDLGNGEFKGFVANMMKIQILNGRDVCNVLGGCTPCPIVQFICPNLEFVFYDVEPHSLDFTTTFDLYAYNLDGTQIAMGQRQPDGGIRVFFTRPTLHSSGEEANFFFVLRPRQNGLPWKFDFWGRVEMRVDNPDPLKQYDVDNNHRIDTAEFFVIMDQWTDGFIPDALFFAGLDYWASQLPIGGVSLIESESFNVRRLAQSITFTANDATSMRVSLYDTQGNLIFAKWTQGSRLTWNMQNINGNRVANGVYFVQLTSEDANGRVSNALKKIAVMN